MTAIRIGLALALAAPLASGAVRAAPPPQGISASYSVLMNGGQVAVMNETFEASKNGYRIVSESSAVGIFALFERAPLRFISSGRITAAGLRPEHFEGKRGEADRRQVRAEFDWETKQLTLTHHGRTETMTLPPRTQDRLSFMYQFMFHDFDGHGQRFDLTMTNGRKLDSYRYAVHPDVELETPLGRLKTLRLVRQRDPDETSTEIWLARDHRFLPVKMVTQEKDGPRYEQIIVKLELTP